MFVPLYMVLSGFYKAKWSDIYKSAVVLLVCAAFAQSLNFILEGSDADFMMLRYGRGNPFVSILENTPALYYILMAAVAIGGSSLLITITLLIQRKVYSKKNIA